jgi:tyrosinase
MCLFGSPFSAPFQLTCAKYEDWPSTLRRPDSDLPSATSRGFVVDNLLKMQTAQIRATTYKLLNISDYGVFSHDAYNGTIREVEKFTSIEEIHGHIHVVVGSTGHMGVGDFAAFDPIFWLHHANVSKLPLA